MQPRYFQGVLTYSCCVLVIILTASSSFSMASVIVSSKLDSVTGARDQNKDSNYDDQLYEQAHLAPQSIIDKLLGISRVRRAPSLTPMQVSVVTTTSSTTTLPVDSSDAIKSLTTQKPSLEPDVELDCNGADNAMLVACISNCASCARQWRYGVYHARACAAECVRRKENPSESVDPECNHELYVKS